MRNSSVKKIFAGLSSACLLASALPSMSLAVSAETAVNYGDANLDGEANIADAVYILQSLANPDKYTLNDEAKSNADVYNRGDGVTASDALSIQKKEAGLLESLPESWAEGTNPETPENPDPVADTVYIHLNGASISVEGDEAGYTAVSGSVVTISHSGTYYIDGTLDDGQINVNIADETADAETVKIFLNGVNITGKSAPAILVTNANNTSINLVDGTENFVSDGDTAYTGDDGLASGEAVIEAKDDLTVKGGELGTGKLTVTANTQPGIVCNNDLKFTGGTTDVTTLNATDETDGIKGKASVTVKGGTVNVDAEGDGIKSSKGSVAVSDGTIGIKAGNDAVQAETTIDISGGTVIAGGDRGFTSVSGTNITGGTVIATATDNQIDSALLKSANQATVLLNCTACADTADGTWKKANTITAGDLSYTFTKKYAYALISDPSIQAGQTYTLKNAGTGATVTHTNDTADTFKVTNSVTAFDTVNPAGKDGSTATTDPTATGYTITLSGASIQTNAPSDVATVSNNVLTIVKEGVFEVTGEGKGSQIVVDVDKTAYPDSVVELDLAGMSLTNDSVAPVYVASIGDEVQIVAKNGTENTISDGTSHTDTYVDSDGNTNQINSAIFSRDDLKIKGKGTLVVNGNYQDGIVSKNDLKIYNGTVKVTAVDDGIRGKDSVTIGDTTKSDGTPITDYSGLNVTVKTSAGDGIKSTGTDVATTSKQYGIVTINGGTIDINSYADGIQAEQYFVMNNGDVNIYTYQGSSFAGSGSSSSSGSTDPWSSGRPGSSGMGGMQDGNSNKTDISAKGIKAVGLYDTAGTTWQSVGDIAINGGNITIDSSDDSIHCGGDMNLTGGNITVSSADDGFHSDHALTIGTKGNGYDDVVISVLKSYEGVEGQQIYQNSGTVIVKSTDDGFNAAGGSDGSGSTVPGGNPWEQGSMGTSGGNYIMEFNGGFALVNVDNGDHDGYDSNGDIHLYGGIQITNGNEPFDCGDSGNSISVNGSTWVSNCTSGGMSMGGSEMSASVTASSSLNAGTRLSLVGSDGKVVVSFLTGKAVSELKAGGTSATGASFQTGGTVSGGTELSSSDGSQVVYIGGSLSGGTAVTGSSSGSWNPWG